jgi:hypothetical protein
MTLAMSPQVEKAPRRLGRMAWVGLASLLLVAALVVEGRSMMLFRTVAPWSSPQQIHFCGRDYNRGGAVSASAVEEIDGVSPFQQLTRGPLWQPVYGHPASAEQWATAGVPCAMVLYMREDGGYRSYALSGAA